MRAHRRQRIGLAEPRRDAAAEAGPDRGVLARGGGVGGDGGGAVLGGADLGRGRGREDDGKEEPSHGGPDLGRGGAMTAPRFLTLGHGYSAAALAASLRGWRLLRHHPFGSEGGGDARRPASSRSTGPTQPRSTAAIAAADGILVSLPPDGIGDPVLVRHEAALAARPDHAWIGYLSTTGVYGDRQGGWVDEESALAPVNDRGRWRRAAERAWAATGLPVHLFRLAGIYGPGRSAFDRLREGRAQRVVKPGQVFSRIHVDDMAAVLAASMARPDPGRTYNVADDEPAPPQDVIAFAAELLGMPVPPEVPLEAAELSPMARSFYAESKRVANRRIKDELGVTLAYPDYRAGLRAILAAGG